jgi:iron complex outermembrane receptor protein
MKSLSSYVRVLTLLVSVAALRPALGQQSDSGGLAEIVVTAQRQEQSVLSVSESVQAVSEEQLRNIGIRDLTNLQFVVPGYLPSMGSGYTQIFIRGIGNSVFVGADPSVATYIDDVPRIYGSMVNQLIDVDRVEVLKGAQGGLYGRNATGGVVNVVTRQPQTNSLTASGLIDYGELNTLRAAGYANIPLTDKMAMSFSVERDSHDPYVRNISQDRTPYTAAMFPGGSLLGTAQQTADYFNTGLQPSNGYDDQSFWAVDGKLLIRPADDFKITVSADYAMKTDSEGGQLYQTIPENNQATLTGLLDLFTGANAQLPPGFLKSNDGNFTTSMGLPTPVNLIDYGTSATLVWNLPDVDLTSISAYRHQSTFYFTDLGADTVPLESVSVRNFKHFFYQELRALSTSEGPFHFLGGATYLKNDFTGNTQAYVLNPLFAAPLTHVNTIVDDVSVYAQVGYDFTRLLNLTVSGRYIHEKNDTNFTAPVSSAADSTESKFLPAATLSYKLDHGNVYARWARGFKAGGVNPVASPSVFPQSDEGSIFGPEQVDTYEIGYRESLFNGNVQFTTAAFYNDYTGLQVSAHAKPQFESEIVLAIVNAGSARTWGIEETLQARVAPTLTLGVNAGYLNAEYKQFSIANNPVLADFNLDHTTMTNSPKIQLGLTAALDQPLNDRLRLVGNVLESYISKVVFGPSGNPGVLPVPEGPAYWMTNVRLGVRTTDDKYGVAIFANNLFDRAYITQGTSVAATGNQLVWGTRRIVGAEVTVRY